MEDKLIYSVPEISKILGVNRNFVYKLINSGYLKARKIGSLKITKESLLEFIKREDDVVFNEKKEKTTA